MNEKRELGHSGILTSALGLGCWAIGGGNWGDNDDSVSVATIRRAVELGINWIDTAPAYNFGHSEEVVGRALRELPRDKVIISTKCGLQWYDEGGEYAENYLDDVTKEQREELEEQLDVVFNAWLEKHDIYPNLYTIPAYETDKYIDGKFEREEE